MLHWLLDGSVPVPGGELRANEVVGNLFGLASAIFGMRRLMWAWPVGMVGNVLLFTVFVGAADEPLWGQAGRQIMFFLASAYGFWRWHRIGDAPDGGAVSPRWATWRERGLLVASAAVLYAAAWVVLLRIGSYSPPTEAWILAGSLLATVGMARGWVEFWLVWVAVDAVGVTTLVHAGYYPTAFMYLFYACFVLWGFVTWTRIARQPAIAAQAAREQEGAVA
ncbi:nicotinamide mononucleotide transporter [Nocardioides anomalus]|uniref:Nicotinamide mononucleotide transporter n=1 Tax=Nocardioides anomalus TaxID=2712223 RepID=A0A6G6WE78_9ACTN|nr:nicotinamide riboside transporter PnuC [Nocardioides anomalus]QIG43457.1 nicotinamide mononucleotide transporter [Nocardioides anomalus]